MSRLLKEIMDTQDVHRPQGNEVQIDLSCPQVNLQKNSDDTALLVSFSTFNEMLISLN